MKRLWQTLPERNPVLIGINIQVASIKGSTLPMDGVAGVPLVMPSAFHRSQASHTHHGLKDIPTGLTNTIKQFVGSP